MKQIKKFFRWVWLVIKHMFRDDAEGAVRDHLEWKRIHLAAYGIIYDPASGSTTDCRTAEGVSVGLVDGIIAQARVLRRMDVKTPAMAAALLDLRQDEDLKWLYMGNGWEVPIVAEPDFRNDADWTSVVYPVVCCISYRPTDTHLPPGGGGEVYYLISDQPHPLFPLVGLRRYRLYSLYQAGGPKPSLAPSEKIEGQWVQVGCLAESEIGHFLPGRVAADLVLAWLPPLPACVLPAEPHG